jgi:pimeloyl-ACP methyl ester carboxylesterase
VVVLVHGFQGNAFDMRLFKNNLSVVYPDALFLSSSSNEDCTDGDINVMGKNLATEVQAYITEWCPGNILGRISFVGHSLGGVIIRAALPLLSDYKEKMYTFFTLSSPHLGYMHNNNKIINAGFGNIYEISPKIKKILKIKNRPLGFKKMEKKHSVETTLDDG